MPTSTLIKEYGEDYFDNLCKKADIPLIFGYYAWLLNEGTGKGEDIINSVVKYRNKLRDDN